MEIRINSYKRHLIEELCNEHNKLRKNPEIYIEPLKKVLNLIRRNKILHLQDERPFKTIEGKVAVLEAINYLSNIPKTLVEKLSNRLFIMSDYLNLASLDHAEDIGFSGSTSHIGSDNSHMNDRVEKYCFWSGGLAESIDFGTKHAQNIMLKLLICDGDKNRTQRKYIFDPGFIYFGAGFCQHLKYKRCSVISYAAFIQSYDDDLGEKELIQINLDIRKNFQNKNIKDINKFFNRNNKESISNADEIEKGKEKEKEKEKSEDNTDRKDEDDKNDSENDNLSFKKKFNIEEDDDENDNLSFKRSFRMEAKSDVEDDDNLGFRKRFNMEERRERRERNDNLLVIEEKENDNEKEENTDRDISSKITKIKDREVERFGLKLKESTYQIKEGNFHIIEEENYVNKNFDFLKLI